MGIQNSRCFEIFCFCCIC